MQVFFMKRYQLKIAFWIVISTIGLFGLGMHGERIARAIFGVKHGISLEGHNLEGMLPEEITAFVAALAEKLDRPPRNAAYFAETGEIIPARSGRKVAVAQTVRRVCQAPCGSRLGLVTFTIQPQIREDLFRPVYSGNKDQPRIALTFNVGWGEDYLPDILKILKDEKVTATFFFVGSWARTFPDLVREIVAQGHEAANHGYFHKHPFQMTRTELQRLITDNTDLLTQLLGNAPAKLFAPPYGEVNTDISGAAGAIGYRTIMWSSDAADWKNPPPGTVFRRIMDRIEPGGIILLHPTLTAQQALRPLLRALKERGLQPGTVSQLLEQ